MSKLTTLIICVYFSTVWLTTGVFADSNDDYWPNGYSQLKSHELHQASRIVKPEKYLKQVEPAFRKEVRRQG